MHYDIISSIYVHLFLICALHKHFLVPIILYASTQEIGYRTAHHSTGRHTTARHTETQNGAAGQGRRGG